MQRSDFPKLVKRIVVKVGTAVVTESDGSFALGRLGYVVEQIAQLQKLGKQVLLVSSGSVGKGIQELSRQTLLTLPLSGFLTDSTNRENAVLSPRASAAAGQSGLMSLYEDMFSQKGVAISQILVTENDLTDTEIMKTLRETLELLLKLNVVPIINENDVISKRKTPIRDEQGAIFWDNDSLAALMSSEVKADLLIILSDVDGIYSYQDFNDPHPEIISTYKAGTKVYFNGTKSRMGHGGMDVLVQAALSCIDKVPAVVVASGFKRNSIINILDGKRVGTLFTKLTDNRDEPKNVAIETRNGSLALRSLKPEERTRILLEYASLLSVNKQLILDENRKDIAAASGLDPNLIARLNITDSKLGSLITGIKQIAASPDPLGRVITTTEVGQDLVLQKLSTPIGVLLVIFESRPDVLPQLAALAIRSGNGLILKGGKEAHYSNTILHKLVQDAISKVTSTNCSLQVPSSVIGLVNTREEVDELLKLKGEIDLVIPRGSSSLVRHTQQQTKIPVLGHAEGICHIYVDEHAILSKAMRIVKDAKLDYPAACNAVETLLLHEKIAHSLDGIRIIQALIDEKIELFGCPKAFSLFSSKNLKVSKLEKPFHHEYNQTKLTVVIVSGVVEAVQHINHYGSNHTEAIITEDPVAAQIFLSLVDSACVFHNASTRFSDGFRFGLGAEVGISTGRIHARGPVGVEGLLTTKWVLRSSSAEGDIVSEFSKGQKTYTHKQLSKL